jgi:hypothetical protein
VYCTVLYKGESSIRLFFLSCLALSSVVLCRRVVSCIASSERDRRNTLFSPLTPAILIYTYSVLCTIRKHNLGSRLLFFLIRLCCVQTKFPFIPLLLSTHKQLCSDGTAIAVELSSLFYLIVSIEMHRTDSAAAVDFNEKKNKCLVS